MKKIAVLLGCLFCLNDVDAQEKRFHFSAGPEVLKSFNHRNSYWGFGGNVQAEVWVKPALGLGLTASVWRFEGADNVSPGGYTAVPLAAIIRYPIPIVKGLYGQDAFGYTLVNGVQYPKDGQKVSGGFAYYFSLGYVVGKHIDISAKVGRSRLNKKDNPANVNEHNFGLKIAYRL